MPLCKWEKMMSEQPVIDLFYLDRQNTNVTSDWRYYRVRPIYQMHIETCEVEFPSFKDKSTPTQHPWIVELASAHDIKGKHLASLGIDQDRSILIGIVVQPENVYNKRGIITLENGY
jgi:hypothetical protein